MSVGQLWRCRDYDNDGTSDGQFGNVESCYIEVASELSYSANCSNDLVQIAVGSLRR